MHRAGSIRSVISEYELELGGHTVYPGGKVNVKWKGAWYNGTISKIGPRRQMCRIRDMVSNHTLLLDRAELKPMESFVLESNFSPGSRVAYNDGDSWSEGVVESSDCVGAALVCWRQSVHSAENENWFEITELAPVIDNEAYLVNDEDLLQAGKSGLLQADSIEPRPMQRENVLYESDDSDAALPTHLLTRTASQQEDEHFYHVLDENQPPLHRIPLTANAYESIPDVNDEEHRYQTPKTPRSPSHHTARKKSPSHKHPQAIGHSNTLPHPHAFSYPPPQGYFPPPFIAGPWGMYQSFPHHSAMQPYPPQRPLSPVKLPLNKTLEQSSLPCAWSYSAHYRNGIPPHSTSTFFQQMRAKLSAPIRNRSKVMPSSTMQNFGPLKKSPSNISKAASEPVFGRGIPAYLSTLEAIPRKDAPGKSLFSKKPKEKSPKIAKIEEEKLTEVERELSEIRSPAPYEVPVKENLYEEVDAEKDTKKGKKKEKSVKKKSPKRKSSDKDSAVALTIASSSPPSVSVNVGASTLLTCLSTGGKKVKYQWRVEDEKLPSKAHPNKVVKAPGILEIQKCTPSDEGLYYCTVSNKWGTSSRTFHLAIIGEISRSPSSPDSFPGSPQVALPAGGEPSLQSSFNNKVTYAELSLPVGVDIDGNREPESVQEFLDNLVGEIHISEDEFNLEDFEQLPQRPPGDGKESVLPVSSVTSKEADLSVPQIIVTTEPSKSLRLKHRRVSNAIKNDNEDYLVGYGQDYGAISSATDLEKEGLSKFPAKEIAKTLKETNKKKSGQEAKKPKAKKKFNLFSRSTKKSHEEKREESEVLEYRDVPSPTRVTFAEPTQNGPRDGSHIRDSGHTDVNSVGVNTSLGSEPSESSLVKHLQIIGAGDEKLQLPTEEATISEQVARLQHSVEEYRQQEMLQHKDKKGKGVFSKFSKKAKS